MTLPTCKWKTKSPSDPSHVVVTECQLNHFTDLLVFLFHRHTVIATLWYCFHRTLQIIPLDKDTETACIETDN